MVTNELPVEAHKAKKVRSPAYPGISLEEALDRAETIRKKEGKNEANVNTILAHWGYKPKSGLGLVVLSALIKYGLMSDNGSGAKRKARLTDMALKILLDDRPESSERLALMREAALTPSIHKDLWEKYKEALPSDLNLRYFLRSEKQFNDNAADDLIQEYRQTLAFTKLGESVNISHEGDEKQEPEGEIKMPNMLIEDKSTSPENAGELKQSTTPTIKQIQIPLTGTTWAIVQVPVPMSEENWKEMQDFLALMKKPITGSSSPTEAG